MSFKSSARQSSGSGPGEFYDIRFPDRKLDTLQTGIVRPSETKNRRYRLARYVVQARCRVSYGVFTSVNGSDPLRARATPPTASGE